MEFEIRQERESDYFETEAMTRRAFYNKHSIGCFEHLMVHVLRSSDCYLPQFSRVAVADGHVVGTIMYFMAKIVVDEKEIPVPSFGPLCVDHAYKNRGIGSALLEESLTLLKESGYPGVVIFGEPEYYPKHGFVRAGSLGLTDAQGKVYDPFMAIEFTPGSLSIPGGKFMEPEEINNFSEQEMQEFDQQFEYLMPAIRPCQWSYPNASDEREGYHLQYAVMNPTEFDRMFEEYVISLSAYDPDAGKYDVSELVAEIRQSVTDASYLIQVGNQTAGLLVTSVPKDPVTEECASYLQELYVAPAFRRLGIASDIFTRFIRSQTKDVGFCFVENSPAGALWKKLLQENGYRYDLYRHDEVRLYCHVHNSEWKNKQ